MRGGHVGAGDGWVEYEEGAVVERMRFDVVVVMKVCVGWLCLAVCLLLRVMLFGGRSIESHIKDVHHMHAAPN